MKLKEIEGDFCVREDAELELVGEGDFTYFLLKKSGWSNLDALSEIARKLRIKKERLNIMGMKDKRAITEQYVSGFKIKKGDLERIRVKDMEIKFLGYGKERLALGGLKGNFFKIIVRDLEGRIKFNIKEFKNYFGSQRFGIRKRNIEVGRCIIKGDFKGACETLKLGVERNDYIGILRKLGRRVLQFYISGYQSYLWNKVVGNLDKEFSEIELLGFLTEFEEKEVEEEYNKVMEEEGITKNNFLIKPLPEVSSEGSVRKMFMEFKDFSFKWGDDELNKNKLKVELGFWLAKGQYATEFVNELWRKDL